MGEKFKLRRAIEYQKKEGKKERKKEEFIQVGGAHNNIVAVNEGEIMKSEIENGKEQFDTEVSFYNKIKDDALSSICPSLKAIEERKKERTMILSDVRASVSAGGLFKTAMMDLKIGRRSFQRDVSSEHKESYFQKYEEIRSSFSQQELVQLWSAIWRSGAVQEQMEAMEKERKMSKRDYLTFRDATTTSMQFGFR